MKGWKETYSNIVLDEEYGFKEKKLVKDLEKAIDKTGDLIRKIPDDLEGDDAYQELTQGQNSLEYGLGILPDAFRNLDENKKEISERINYHGKSQAEKLKLLFNRNKEIKNIKKLLKGIEKLNDEHEKFQYNNRVAGAPAKVFDGLRTAESALYNYMLEIERGEWDGVVDLDD